jgi:hypothetical protein
MTGQTAFVFLLLLAAYAAHSVFWPHAKCRWCKGRKRSRSPSGRAWRNCSHCGGSGERLRVGARLFEKGSRR